MGAGRPNARLYAVNKQNGTLLANTHSRTLMPESGRLRAPELRNLGVLRNSSGVVNYRAPLPEGNSYRIAPSHGGRVGYSRPDAASHHDSR